MVPTMEDEQRNTRIPKQLRIFLSLRFLATGHYQRGIGEEFSLSISQEAASKCISEVIEKKKKTEEQKRDIKTEFMNVAGFPRVIGCIDCTHVAILAPPDDEHLYVNRKGFHSKNVQIICSFNLEILSINARYPGSTHDSFIWRGSAVKRYMEQNYRRGERYTWLIGDSGYSLQPWLLTPFENPEPDTPEGRYDRSLQITRSIIERCNGNLKARFRSLLGERTLRYSPEKVVAIVNACAVLHNMCIRAEVELDENLVGVEEKAVPANDAGNYQNDNEGEALRLQDDCDRKKLPKDSI